MWESGLLFLFQLLLVALRLSVFHSSCALCQEPHVALKQYGIVIEANITTKMV